MPFIEGSYEIQIEHYMQKHFNNVCFLHLKKGREVVYSDT